MVDLKVVVTGTGRCGTVFMANLLTSLGWPCGHEAVFGPYGMERAREILSGARRPENSEISRNGTILSDESHIVGDSSYMSAPFLSEVDAFVVHLVRNPMNVVASLVGDMFRNFSGRSPADLEDVPDHILYEGFMYRHLPELGEDMPQLDRGCLFYLRWNEMIEASGRVDMFHRIEDPTDRIRKMFGDSGWHYSDALCNSFSEYSRRWSESDIQNPRIRSEMQDIMKRYGYKKPTPLL
jgi:hypothetical protein